jgi:hypothetical protein
MCNVTNKTTSKTSKYLTSAITAEKHSSSACFNRYIKYTMLSVSFIIVTTYLLYSQEKDTTNLFYRNGKDRKFSLGIKFGGGPSYFDMVDDFKNDSFQKNGLGNFIIGLMSEYKINKHFSFGSELLYECRGGGFSKINNNVMLFTVQGNASDEKAYYYNNYNINSIDIPFFFRAGIGKNRTLFFINAGISPSIVLRYVHNYNDWEYSWYTAKQTWYREENDALDKTISLAYLGGIGFRITFHRIIIIPELRFTRFFNNELIVGNVLENSKFYSFIAAFSMLYH